MGIRHDMWDGALWKTSRAGGSAGKRGDHGRGGGTVDRRLGSCVWGAVVGGVGFCGRWPAVGTWRVGDRRLGFCGSGSLRHVDRRFAGRGWGLAVCDLGLGFAAWGWGVIRATGVWGLGRSLGRTELCGLGWGLRFEAGIRCSRFAARCLEVAIRGWGLGFAVWGGRNFTVLPGVCGLDAVT